MRRFLRRAATAAFVTLALPLATLGTGSATAAPAAMMGKASLSDFNTTLTGKTSDGKHTVAINVDWTSLIKTHVDVEISVDQGTGSLSALNGSSYTYTLPAHDFTLTSTSASLDTHGDLGKVGHITAHWTYVSKAETSNCFGSSTAQHVIASGSATFNLSFPCDGKVSGQISGNNVDSDSATSTSEGNSTSGFSGLPSLYFMAVTAEHSSGGVDLDVGAYQFGGLGKFVYVSVGAGNGGNDDTSNNAKTGLTTAEFGLTQYSHFASDKLNSGVLTTGKNPAASLNYSGSLCKANIVWHAKSGKAFNMTMQGSCLNKALTGSDAKAAVVFSTQEATVTGSAKIKACVSAGATFGAHDTGGVINTRKGT
ncbi:MAG: hypothetical protein ACRDG4_02185, partial [Chloroflexota bacterium]